MDERNSVSAAETTPQTIRLLDLNPLFQGSLADVSANVRGVLNTLSVLEPLDGVNPDRLNHGMSLIHDWLAASLEIAEQYPDLEAVIPVMPKTGKGGAS